MGPCDAAFFGAGRWQRAHAAAEDGAVALQRERRACRDRRHRCRWQGARRRHARGRPILADRFAGRPAAGHANRQLPRGLAGRSSGGGIDGIFNRCRHRGRAAGDKPPAGGADLAGADRGLSRPVCRCRRRVLRGLDRAGLERIGGQPRRACHRSCQRGGLARPAGPRSPQSSDWRHRDIGAVGERARDLPRAVAVDCDRGDGRRRVRVEKPEQDDCRGVDRARHGGRRAVAGDERACGDRLAAMADPAVAVPARRRRGLLDRRAGAARGDGASAQATTCRACSSSFQAWRCCWSLSWC